LFVVDADGTASDGYEITFGEGEAESSSTSGFTGGTATVSFP